MNERICQPIVLTESQVPGKRLGLMRYVWTGDATSGLQIHLKYFEFYTSVASN